MAAVVGGAPSTLHALATGADVLEATRAAGTLVPGTGPSTPRWRLVVAGVAVHAVLSAGWTVVLDSVLPEPARPRRRLVEAVAGAVAGAGIAALDLGVVAPRIAPAIAALPIGPQVADHVAFGAVVGALR